MKKILLVEDDQFISDLYKRVLVEGGYEVDTAMDGLEAQTKTTQILYDLVLLDIMIPKLNGMDLLKQLKSPSSAYKNVPVFLITNLGQESLITDAFKIGADGYFIKAQYFPKDIVNEINTFFANKEKLGKQQSESTG